MKEVVLEEYVWCEGDDRYVYIRRDYNGDIVGLNFMQGKEGLEYFKKEYGRIDRKITHFYHAVKHSVDNGCYINDINTILWMWCSYDMCKNNPITFID